MTLETSRPNSKRGRTTSKRGRNFEKSTVYAAITNAEPEVAERYNHILVNMPSGLAVSITARRPDRHQRGP